MLQFEKILILITTFVIMTQWEASGQHFSIETGDSATSYSSHVNVNYLDSETELPSEKSEYVALAWSFGSATIPTLPAVLFEPNFGTITLFVAGILAGPSAGSLYAEDWTRAGQGMLIRGTGAGVAVIGAYVGGIRIFDDPESVGQIILFLGLGVVAGSALYDIFGTSVQSVEDYNDQLRGEQSISIMPWFDSETHSPGLRISYNF